jgi:hypothetical protein
MKNASRTLPISSKAKKIKEISLPHKMKYTKNRSPEKSKLDSKKIVLSPKESLFIKIDL